MLLEHGLNPLIELVELGKKLVREMDRGKTVTQRGVLVANHFTITLSPEDTVAIVVYAGAAGTVLEPTKIAEKHKILAALDNLRAGDSWSLFTVGNGVQGVEETNELEKLVETLKDEDYVAIVAYDMRPEILSDFSTDKK